MSVGNATIHATLEDKGGNRICEADGKVEVGIPLVPTLSMQSAKLCIGCKMPVWASFQEGLPMMEPSHWYHVLLATLAVVAFALVLAASLIAYFIHRTNCTILHATNQLLEAFNQLLRFADQWIQHLTFVWLTERLMRHHPSFGRLQERLSNYRNRLRIEP